MSKNITQSVLHVVACENILSENELNKPDNDKSISELLNEQKEKTDQKDIQPE
jgi:hypothetical protein